MSVEFIGYVGTQEVSEIIPRVRAEIALRDAAARPGHIKTARAG